MNPTPEQLAILDHTASDSSNLMINALAGTGKSNTLKRIDRAHSTKPAVYLVFNRRNKDEAVEAQKAGEFSSTTTIATFNGLGHGIWTKACAHPINLQKDKTRQLWKAMVDEFDRNESRDAWAEYSVVMDGIEKAKNLGYVPADVGNGKVQSLITANELSLAMDEEPNEFAQGLIDQLLRESIRRAYRGLIDFSDQIYMPALFGGPFPKFPRVMVDEYQDQSPVNHALLARLVRERIIGVGDPYQNIYGFRGAKAGGMNSAVIDYSMDQLPLSTSFRCPSEIVKSVHWHVPHFRWFNLGGSVDHAETFHGADFPDNSTIICRNNAPLLRMAFHLLRAGRNIHLVGSEIGTRLITIMKRFGDNSMSKREVIEAIEFWREEKLVANSKSASDLADCMRVFADHGHDLSSMVSYAEHLFAQKGSISLLTGHKSKGLEFSDVYWLDPSLCDHREQDRNLAYVISTRSHDKLTTLDSSSILW